MPLPVLPHMVVRQSSVAGLHADEFDDVALFRRRVEKLAVSQQKYQCIPISHFERGGANGELERLTKL
jgi:hypothetical protein